MVAFLVTRGIGAVALDANGRAWNEAATSDRWEVLVVDATDAAAPDILTHLPAGTRVGVTHGRAPQLDGVDVWVDLTDTRRLVAAARDPRQTARHRPRRNHDAPDGLAALTARERMVLEQLRAGSSNAEIATRLELSANTVRTHVQHLFAKLGVSSRFEAAVMANNAAATSDREVPR